MGMKEKEWWGIKRRGVGNHEKRGGGSREEREGLDDWYISPISETTKYLYVCAL